MTTPPVEVRRVPQATTARVTRAASFGVACVVICLAALSIFGSYRTQTRVERAQQLLALHEVQDGLIAAIAAEKAAEMEYTVDPSSETHAEVGEASEATIEAISEIAAQVGQSNQELANQLRSFHEYYVEATARRVAAIAAGDLVGAHRIDVEETDLILSVMRDRITAVTLDSEGEAEIAFAELRATAQKVLTLTPLVFAIGFVLLLALWWVFERANRATRETYREIEQLSRLRSEFVSLVSHEFRTPLTGIQGFSEMIRDEAMTMPEAREYAGDINKDARRLARLITDMLDLDRMESGRMTLNSDPVDFNRIVTETAGQFRLSAADHPIELELDSHVPMLIGDADRLTQVVTNLVSNAIKYSPKGGAVEIRTQLADRTVTLTVRDHGIGIAPEQLEKIFERYSRVETTETRSISGTGLGLPIVRLIVQLCDGKVWATSEFGQGSVLHVQLPIPEAVAAAPLAA